LPYENVLYVSLNFEEYYLIIKNELLRSGQGDKHPGEGAVRLSYDAGNGDAIPSETVIKVD